ncbi:MAG: hypothetical protein ACRD2B_01790 [Terriglobia bacterium]
MADFLNTFGIQPAMQSAEEAPYVESAAKKRPRVEKPKQMEDSENPDEGQEKHQLDLDA